MLLLPALLALAAAGADCTTPRDYWPTDGWRDAAPASQGIDSAVLGAALAHLARDYPAVQSILVVRHGYVVAERYFGGHDSTERFDLRSATKSIVSALVGIALDRKMLHSVDQPIASLLPEYFLADDVDPRERHITLRHLLTMTSGLDWDEASAGAYFVGTGDWASAILGRPMVAEPGRRFAYSSGNAHLLAMVIARATKGTPLAFANAQLFAPLGFQLGLFDWLTDPQGVNAGGAGLRLSTREMAKIGWLYANEGCWAGTAILPAAWVRASTTKQSDPGPNAAGYGYLWWISKAIPGAYAAIGYGGQYIIVDPALDAVIAVTADPRRGESRHLEVIAQEIVPLFK